MWAVDKGVWLVLLQFLVATSGLIHLKPCLTSALVIVCPLLTRFPGFWAQICFLFTPNSTPASWKPRSVLSAQRTQELKTCLFLHFLFITITNICITVTVYFLHF